MTLIFCPAKRIMERCAFFLILTSSLVILASTVPTVSAARRSVREETINAEVQTRRNLTSMKPRFDQDALRQVAFGVLRNYVRCSINAGNMLRLAFHGEAL
jgi:hypothetical protein